ncbi:hypothetical protein KIPB_004032 [Kipferlia bialata]|uniref:Uncharacterized protein n=1 Tax=Kipferlia bialata TaxID=797122 RepID=A0A9K3CV13_9EUKA|nr:hypothetical protein KIPB_004032 [Kipferlia bialata]|eukprot:g4032.t1
MRCTLGSILLGLCVLGLVVGAAAETADIRDLSDLALSLDNRIWDASLALSDMDSTLSDMEGMDTAEADASLLQSILALKRQYQSTMDTLNDRMQSVDPSYPPPSDLSQLKRRMDGMDQSMEVFISQAGVLDKEFRLTMKRIDSAAHGGYVLMAVMGIGLIGVLLATRKLHTHEKEKTM